VNLDKLDENRVEMALMKLPPPKMPKKQNWEHKALFDEMLRKAKEALK